MVASTHTWPAVSSGRRPRFPTPGPTHAQVVPRTCAPGPCGPRDGSRPRPSCRWVEGRGTVNEQREGSVCWRFGRALALSYAAVAGVRRGVRRGESEGDVDGMLTQVAFAGVGHDHQ